MNMLLAQQTAVFTDAQRSFKQGVSDYEDGLLAKARREFKTTMDLLLPLNEASSDKLRTEAQLYYAKCGVQLGLADGETNTLNFIREHRPDPEYQQAIVDLADYYFNNRDYDKALDYYGQAPAIGMSKQDRLQMRFRQGYANFVKQQFTAAKSFFRDVSREKDSDYYNPSNYYLGLIYFNEGDYTNAITSFLAVENDPTYKPHIPYYITQIYFAQRNFDKVIEYGTRNLNDTRVRNGKELRQLVGQAYFEKGDYANALPFLEEYAKGATKLREEELYQLGFTQYRAGKYNDAVRSLKPLSTADSPIGQNAMFYLADCYLRLNQKQDALAALGTAKRLNYDATIQEEALFNHAKLAYELNNPREAVNDLQTIQPQSRYYLEAQRLLSEVFLSYRDYQQALNILEEMRKTNPSPQLQATYQQVAVNRGMQLLQNNDPTQAKVYFQRSLENPVNIRQQAIALYWMGDIANREENYPESTRYLDRFLTAAKPLSDLPEESSVFTANYLLGYNYLKIDNYEKARGYFQTTVEGINRNRRFIKNPDISNNLLGDATLRLGDSYFKFNQYESAARYYDEAIERKYIGSDYAMYQKAIIEGLRGRKTDEIVALERLVRDQPSSEFADDALLRLGTTYQEIGKLNQAVEPLRQLITRYQGKSPLINQALLRLGLISYNLGNYEGAINYYKQVFGNNPAPEEASLALAALEEIYVKDLGRPGDYTAFLETVPGYKVDNFVRDSINFKAAETRFEAGDYPRAVESYTAYIRAFPQGLNVLTAYYNRGESYSVLRNYSPALSDYEWVIQQGPSRFYVKALEKAAIIAYNHELDFQKSYNYYSQLERSATNEDMIFDAQLGAMRSAYRSGRTDAVYELANKVSRNPRASKNQVATANFYIGKVAFDRNDYTAALPALNKVTQLSDNEQTAEARYLIAFIYYRQRDLNKAQDLCLQANQESSAYPYWVAKSVLLLADVLAEKGDLYNARAALEALLDNYKEDAQLVEQARTRLAQINKQIETGSILNKTPGTTKSLIEIENNGNNR
ncbi:MAG: tetratricopeptide repeat protein [Lewinellaceae bacterium]|nr:tetratricopeptide repeat protein [Lewinellaceae bacterium]